MSELVPFDYSGLPIRTVVIDGAPWFFAADVCAALSIDPSQTRRLDDDEKGLYSTQTPGGAQQVTIVSEPGLYSLVIRSRKSEAKVFKRWITHEVIPAIRKTGGYGQSRELTRLELIDLAREAEVGRLEAEKRLAVAAPKAEYVDAYVRGDEDATILRVVANQLHLGERWLREFLINQKVIYRRLLGSRFSHSKGRLVKEFEYQPYSEYKAWFRVGDQPEAPRVHNGQVRTTLYVTPIGKVKIAELVRKQEIAEAQ